MRVIAPCHTHLKLSLPWRQWWRLDEGMTVQQSEGHFTPPNHHSRVVSPPGRTRRRPEPRRGAESRLDVQKEAEEVTEKASEREREEAAEEPGA